jgi:dephospho-CoA kinase
MGTGKSEALKFFAAAGAETLCADAIAHELSQSGGPAYRAIVRAFGPRILAKDGSIDRKALGKMIFSDAKLRRRLERATHPFILRALQSRLKALKGSVAVVDIPLLFEAGLASNFDVTILVSTGFKQQLSRIMQRDGLERRQALKRMRSQWPLKLKERLADVVLVNDGTSRRLRREVFECYQALQLIARSGSAASSVV